MTSAREGSFTPCRSLVAMLLAASLALGSGCARPLLQRAIAARGGPLTTLSRDVEADVYAGFPGTWTWRFDYRVPDSLRWTIQTYGEEQSVSFDGKAVRFYLGDAPVAAPPGLGDFRSQVRWLTVTTLDALADDDQIVVRELAASELPAGAASGLAVTYRDDGARYGLYFDAADLLIAAEGPIVLPTIAAGQMHAAFTEFGAAGEYRLPYRGSYTLDARPFFDERILRYAPNDPRLTPASFSGPPVAAAR